MRNDDVKDCQRARTRRPDGLRWRGPARNPSLLLVLAGATCFAAGVREFELEVEGAEDKIVVSLPANHSAGGKFPAVFYYHGTSGRPSTSLIRAHAGDEDWIVAGMAYARRGVFQLTPAGMDAEIRILRAVRDQLRERAGLDPGRVYVSGFSKGGWVSGLLLQRERSLAGAAIMGAGHMHKLEAVPKPFRKKVPVFVAVGRLDNNYTFALRAKVFFHKLGARVEMETWRGIAHSFPKYGSKGLREWFELQRGVSPDRKELEGELRAILDLEGFEKWWALIEFRERPFVRATEGLADKIDRLREEVEQDPATAREGRILKESRRLLRREIGMKTIEDLEKICAGYERIVKGAPKSPQGEAAKNDHQRVAKNLEMAREQQAEMERRRKELEVDDKIERRGIPLNPLIR